MKKYLSVILLFLLLSVEFIPNFLAIDLIGPQWLYLSILNLLIFVYNLTKFKTNIQEYYFNILREYKVTRFLIIIFCFAVISIVKAVNIPEALIGLTNLFLIFVTLFHFLLLQRDTNFSYLKKLFITFTLLVASIEVFLSIKPIIIDLLKSEYAYSKKKYYGLGANVNITSFILLMKLPIIIYAFKTSNSIIKIFIYVLYTSIVVILFSLGTRLALLLFFCLLILLCLSILYSRKEIKNFILIIIPIIIAPLYLSFQGRDYSNEIISDNLRLTSGKDSSIQLRLNYYEDAVNTIFNNVFNGIGIGNWKLESVKLDYQDIVGYRVPYHVHNDILEIGAETGLFSMLAYSLFLLYPFYLLFKRNRLIHDKFYIFCFSTPCLIFLVDTFFNFPLARPISIIFFCFVYSNLLIYQNEN